MYRIPITSSERIHTASTQYNQIEGKVKDATAYRKEVLKEIEKYVIKQNPTDIIVIGDIN